jgi:hypothetical protein
VLVRQLPPGARTRLAQGDSDGLWGLAEHLTALLIDEVRAGNWQRANAGARKGQQTRRPRPIDRPGTGRRRADKNSPERQAKRADARRRAAERRAAIARGDIT